MYNPTSPTDSSVRNGTLPGFGDDYASVIFCPTAFRTDISTQNISLHEWMSSLSVICRNAYSKRYEESTSAYAYYFVPVFCFLFFNLADLFGREVASRIQWPSYNSPRWILPSLATGRIVFIPLFMFCNVVSNEFRFTLIAN